MFFKRKSNPIKNTDLAFFQAARKGLNRLVLVAITIIIILAGIAITGVYYNYW